MIPETANEAIVRIKVQPLLDAETAYRADPVTGPDVVMPSADGTTPWWGCYDAIVHPDHPNKDDPGVFPKFSAAYNSWKAAGMPFPGGVCIMPGIVDLSNWPLPTGYNENRINEGPVIIRAQNKETDTTWWCEDDPYPRNGFSCHPNAGHVIFDGFSLMGVHGGAHGSSGYTEAGIRGEHNVNITLYDMYVQDCSNGMRTSGGDIAIFGSVFHDCSHYSGAHPVYTSHSKKPGSVTEFYETEIVVARESCFLDPRMAHGFKTRGRYFFGEDCQFDTVNGFCLDNVHAGFASMRNCWFVRKAGNNWRSHMNGGDRIDGETGMVRYPPVNQQGKDDWNKQHLIVNKWGGSQNLDNINGQTSLRDCLFSNWDSPNQARVSNWSSAMVPDLNNNDPYDP
ncbi:MAG: hypothetical protein ACR2RB_00100, partial [Gammaproteobacteria bacterium]